MLHALSSSDDKIRTSFTATFLVLDLCSMLIVIAYSLARFVHSLAEQIFTYFLQPAPCLTRTRLDLGIRIQGEHSFLYFRASSFGLCLIPWQSKKISCAYSLKLKFSSWVLLVCRHRDYQKIFFAFRLDTPKMNHSSVPSPWQQKPHWLLPSARLVDEHSQVFLLLIFDTDAVAVDVLDTWF